MKKITEMKNPFTKKLFKFYTCKFIWMAFFLRRGPFAANSSATSWRKKERSMREKDAIAKCRDKF